MQYTNHIVQQVLKKQVKFFLLTILYSILAKMKNMTYY